MLKAYEGTILFVSHDRYFIKEISNKLLVFENGYTKFYEFGYEDYVAQKALQEEMELPKNSKEMNGKTPFSFASAKAEEKPKAAKNYDNPGKEKSKLQRKLAKLEENISKVEEDIEKEKAELVNPEYASAYTKLSTIQSNIDSLEETLMKYMEQWEAVTKELEEFD